MSGNNLTIIKCRTEQSDAQNIDLINQKLTTALESKHIIKQNGLYKRTCNPMCNCIPVVQSSIAATNARKQN
jgi:hypothetical protein